MPILQDGVYSSISYHGRGIFRFDRIPYNHKILLKSITQRQRKKFKNHELVPIPLLQVLWDMGYLPGHERPQEGMRIPENYYVVTSLASEEYVHLERLNGKGRLVIPRRTFEDVSKRQNLGEIDNAEVLFADGECLTFSQQEWLKVGETTAKMATRDFCRVYREEITRRLEMSKKRQKLRDIRLKCEADAVYYKQRTVGI